MTNFAQSMHITLIINIFYVHYVYVFGASDNHKTQFLFMASIINKNDDKQNFLNNNNNIFLSMIIECFEGIYSSSPSSSFIFFL